MGNYEELIDLPFKIESSSGCEQQQSRERERDTLEGQHSGVR